MDPLIISGLVGAGASLIGGAVNNAANYKAVREQNKGNFELAKYQYDRNVDLWNMNNAYNTPSSQMERYQAAGLNPNLIYGNGSSSSGNASAPASSPSAHGMVRPNYDSSFIPSSAQLLMNGLTQASAIRKNDAETALTYQNLQNSQEDNRIKKLMVIQQEYQNAKTFEEKQVWAEKLRAEISNIDSRTMLNDSNAFLADQNRLLVKAQMPYLVEESKERVSKLLAETGLIRSKTRGQNINNEISFVELSFRDKLLVSQISNYVAQAQLSDSSAEVNRCKRDIHRVLLDSGLNLDNDAFDRLYYQMTYLPGGAETSNWMHTAKFAGKVVGSAVNLIK